jgi:pimeloyl-ACP methyl ester carboxylesterase
MARLWLSRLTNRVEDRRSLDAAVRYDVSASWLPRMIAMETALLFPEHVAALVLICTSASIDHALWADRVHSVRAGGTLFMAFTAPPGSRRRYTESVP